MLDRSDPNYSSMMDELADISLDLGAAVQRRYMTRYCPNKSALSVRDVEEIQNLTRVAAQLYIAVYVEALSDALEGPIDIPDPEVN